MTFRPSDALGYLIVQVPALIGAVWGGCWNILPEFYRLSVGARNARSLRRLNNFASLALVLVIGFSFGPLDVQNVADQVFHVGFYFPSIVFDVTAVVSLVAIYSLGMAAIVSKRIHYFVYPGPTRRWSLRRVIAIVSFVLVFAGLYLMVLREFALIGFVTFVGGIIVRASLRGGVSKPAMLSGSRGDSLPLPVKLETGKVGFDKRFALGRKISDMIVQQHGKKILAVCLWGPSASEKEESVSYLDVAAVVKAGEYINPTKKSVCEGIEVTVAYWDESSFMARARDFDEYWPAYRSRFLELKVLYERDAWTRNLRPALEESDRADSTVAIRDESLDMVRHLGILRDDQRSGDPDNIKEECSRIADSAVNLLLLLNHKPYPIGDFWSGILEMPAKPADFRRLVGSAKGYLRVDQQEMMDDTMKLVDEMLEMVRLRGISIETPGPLV